MAAFGIEISEEAVRVFGEGVTKSVALDCLVDAIADAGWVTDREAFRKAVFEREAIMSTGIGGGVGIPHVRIDEVSQPAIAVGVSSSGIEYDTLDDKPVNVMVLFAMPSGSHKDYLGLLAQVMLALKAPGFREKLIACGTREELAAMLNESAP